VNAKFGSQQDIKQTEIAICQNKKKETSLLLPSFYRILSSIGKSIKSKVQETQPIAKGSIWMCQLADCL